MEIFRNRLSLGGVSRLDDGARLDDKTRYYLYITNI
jgi:hypothetical protein